VLRYFSDSPKKPTRACASNTLGYPKAALFTCCLALLADSAVSLLKAALRCAHGRQQGNDEVSGSSLAVEIGRTSDGMMLAIPAPHGALCRALSAKEYANAVRELASSGTYRDISSLLAGPRRHPRSAPRLRTASTSRLRSAWHNDDQVARSAALRLAPLTLCAGDAAKYSHVPGAHFTRTG